jgi:hypothetical protein
MHSLKKLFNCLEMFESKIHTYIPYFVISPCPFSSRRKVSALSLEVKGKGTVVYAMQAYRCSRGIAPLSLNRYTWWRYVVNFNTNAVLTTRKYLDIH